MGREEERGKERERESNNDNLRSDQNVKEI